MATAVHEGAEITLMDGSKIKVRPLKISLLRPFMSKFEQVLAKDFLVLLQQRQLQDLLAYLV